MKQSLFAATAMALIISAGSAVAADLPSRKEAPVYVPPPPPPLWTGFYVGLNAGGTFGGSQSVTTTGGPISNNSLYPAGSSAVANGLGVASNYVLPVNNGGFIGGGQIGYNYQIQQFVIGLEADIQGVAGSSSSASAVTGASLAPYGFPAKSYVAGGSVTKSLGYLGTVRGRIGYLFTPTLLFYGTGGLAYGGANLSNSYFAQESLGPSVYPPVLGSSYYSDTLVGWTAGAGVEWMFLPNWSAKVEYLYYDIGTVTTHGSLLVQSNSTAAGASWGIAGQNTSAKFDGHIVRAGVNYHFNWGAPAPVVAKY